LTAASSRASGERDGRSVKGGGDAAVAVLRRGCRETVKE
jgi:hypothetical protein